MYQFVLLRHGRSLADDEKKFEGRYDSPLTQVGEEQAQKTQQLFVCNGFVFDKIITSPLKRAFRTAEIINEHYKVPIIQEPLLMEWDSGILSGKEKVLMNEKYPMPEQMSPFRYFPEHTGETIAELHARACLALNALIDRGPGKYLIVAHGQVLNALIRNMLGIQYPVNDSGVSFALSDNGFVYLMFDEMKCHWTFITMHYNYNRG